MPANNPITDAQKGYELYEITYSQTLITESFGNAILITCSSSDISIYLPIITDTSQNTTMLFVREDNTTKNVSISPSSPNTLNGVTTSISLNGQYNNALVFSDGSGNWVVQYNTGTIQQNTLANGYIWVGNINGVATQVQLSGDATITSSGVITIANNAITNAKLAQATANTWKGNNTGSTANESDNATASLTESTSSVLTITGGNNAVLNATTIQVKQANTSQNGYISSTDWNTFNNKQNLVASAVNGDIVTTNGSGQTTDSGKVFSTDGTFTSPTDNQVPTSLAVQTYVNSAITSGKSFRGGYNASTNLFPSTGGSGIAGVINAGDFWSITTGGTLGSTPVIIGNTVLALVNIPAQTSANWLISATGVDSVNGLTGVVSVGIANMNDATVSAPTNGQTLIYNATTSKWDNANIAGTTNEIIVTNGAGTITLSTPQALATTSSPTFNTVTASLSGNATTATSATTATTATNLANGANGGIPYQTSSGTTAMLATGTGVLIGGTPPSYSSYAQLNANLAVNTNIIYVSGANGSNSNNGLSWNTAVATLAQAQTLMGNSAGIVKIAPYASGYSENTTLTMTNVTIMSETTNSNVNFTGTINVANTSSNLQINNITFATLNHTDAGALYMQNTAVTTAFSSSGSGYLQTYTCDLQGTATTVSITGAKSVTFGTNTILGLTTINNASIVVSYLNCLNSKAITLTAGIVGIDDTTVYSTSSGTNAISVASGAVLYSTNHTFMVSGTNTPALINLASGSFYSFDNVIYSASSTISGTKLTRTANFDAIALSTALPIASGGTGQTTATNAINALLPTQTSQSGKFLTTNGSVASWATAGSGSGTVTSVSVVSANGFAGTVATATTTPAITLSTTITGILKGNGTAISAGTAGTDYSAGTSALATGILKSTTSTGALTIAVAGDFPTLNQNTTGTASNITGISNSTLATLSVLSLPYSQLSGTVPTWNQNTTGTANSVSGTNVVTNSNLAQMATNTIKGNNTGSTANALDLTATQVTAILNPMVGDAGSGGTQGLAPAPASGDASSGKFLKADGTWAIPAGSGGGTSTPTANTNAQWDSNLNLSANNLLPLTATTATAAGTTTLTISSPSVQFFTGTSAQTVKLPAASTLAVGATFTIINNTTGSAGYLLVTNGSNTSLISILTGNNNTFTLTSNSGTAGVWVYNKTVSGKFTLDQPFIIGRLNVQATLTGGNGLQLKSTSGTITAEAWGFSFRGTGRGNNDDRDNSISITSSAYTGLFGITNFVNNNTQFVNLYDSSGGVYVINLCVVSPTNYITVTFSN